MASDFHAPGPGEWALDRSHYPNGATPISQWLLTEGFHDGFSKVFAELGLPAERIDIEFVNNFMYTRLRPLIGGDKPPRKLPAAVIKLASRLHPAFRERNQTAIASLRDRPSNEVVRRWEKELRPKLQATNVGFQQFDVVGASDLQLQDHVNALLAQLRDNFVLHFWLHGHDLGPIARYLDACLRWGLDPIDSIELLAGASPTTSEPLERLYELRKLVDQSGAAVQSLDDVRAVSPQVKQLLDEYLTDRGHVLVTGYDITATTLIELPDLILDTIMSARELPSHADHGMTAGLRSAVPASQREQFDTFLADARNVMDMRDDNGPMTIEWPVGLLRRALLEAGRRLRERGAVLQPEHLFELSPSEARALFAPTLPTPHELAHRAEARAARLELTPPQTLGPPEPSAPIEALPKALGELIAMTEVALKYIGLDGTATVGSLSGAGIGTQAYVGTARVASSADEAFDRLEPGDVLIVRATSPAFNAILTIAGAVVTSDGGILSHAAVLSRELGIPAVIGASAALDIPDGSTVEVDPAEGRVRVIASANA